MDDRWATATYISGISAIVVLSIVVLTGYAGQLSLGQWALAGMGALIAGNLVLRLDFPSKPPSRSGCCSRCRSGCCSRCPRCGPAA